eukprot:TRINITY_DN70_c3_g1_i2.p1 TRINITY_DN70_c3_g1~~TRINITY_DN70_c3_g1_i2.p1  ORF type:complete len:157 (-),score=85.21 TRINITY_DN70_c3_g1_i2:73-543(-)
MSRRDGLKAKNTVSSEVTEQDIQEAFNVFDTDKDGFILSEEIGTVIRALGKCPYQSEVEAVVKEAGGRGRKIDFRTFSGFYRAKYKKPIDMERDMRNAFSALDADGVNFIYEAQLRQTLGSLGEPLTPQEIDILLRDLADGDGRIDYNKFVDMLVS